ncbi:hydrogenase 3 maturation endopeptidase HyCI [Candidatus Zixiibacteriota bacterium]
MSLVQLRTLLQGRVVIVGVGNQLRGDDGFGPYMIEQLQGKVSAELIDCGEVPENFLGPIRSHDPDTVLILDAADFSARPGALEVFDVYRWEGGGFSSHSLSLRLFADLLTHDTGAQIYLVAIQPKHVELGQAMSKEVQEGCRGLQRFLIETLGHEK